MTDLVLNLNYELVGWIVFLCAVMWGTQAFFTAYFRALYRFATQPLTAAEEQGRKEAQKLIEEYERILAEEARARENKQQEKK